MLQGWAFLMGGTFFALVFRPWRMNYVPNAGRHCRYCGGRAHRQRAGVQLLHERRQVHWAAEIQPVQLCGTVTAAIISTLVLGSPFTVWDAIGFVCIFLMLVLLFISNEKQAKSAASA